MYRYEKKFLKITTFLILLVIMLVTLTGCSKKQNDPEQLKNKVGEEIRYLNEEIIGMMNGLNNITLRNYSIITQNTIQSEKESDSQKSAGSSNSGSSDASSGSSGGGEQSGQKESNQNTMQEESTKAYEVNKGSILTDSKQPNWNQIKQSIERFYSSWSTVVLDLYALNIPKEDIIGFSNELNACVTNIKAEDKIKSMDSLAALYRYLPKYAGQESDQQELADILTIKSNVLDAYRFIETDNWEEIKASLSKAESSYVKLMDQSSGKPNEYAISKGYILLKEFQNAVDGHDKDVLYMKYKSMMEEINSFQ